MASTLDVLQFLWHHRLPERRPGSRVSRVCPYLSECQRSPSVKWGKIATWLSSQARWEPSGRWPHSLLQQADAQTPVAVGATAEDKVGGLVFAVGLHSDDGLGLCLHVHLHNGLDQRPGSEGA